MTCREQPKGSPFISYYTIGLGKGAAPWTPFSQAMGKPSTHEANGLKNRQICMFSLRYGLNKSVWIKENYMYLY